VRSIVIVKFGWDERYYILCGMIGPTKKLKIVVILLSWVWLDYLCSSYLY